MRRALTCSTWVLWILLPAAGLGGCNGDNAANPDLAAPPSLCAHETRADAYSPGLAKTGSKGLVAVALLSSQPGPPAIGVNTWDVAVRDAGDLGSGARNDLAITALPWMPDHNHGTSVKAAVTADGMDGRYTVTPLYLYMAGLWQITLHLQTPTQESDSVVFSFCLEDQ